MEIINQLIIPPSEHYLTLIRYLLIMTSAMHFAYVGMVICATLLSIIFNARDRDIPNPTFARVADDLMKMVLPSRVVALVFGVLPLVAMWLMYSQWLYKAEVHVLGLLLAGVAVVALSFGPISTYRYTLHPEGRNSTVNFMMGGAGVLTLILGAYIVIGCMVRFQDPERWHLEHHVIRELTSFNVIWRFMVMLLAGLMTTGCGIQFFFFDWAGRKTLNDPGYEKYLKNFGSGLAILAVFLVPLLLFFYVVTTPLLAMSGGLFLLACVITAVLFVVFALLYTNVVSDRVRWGTTPFTLSLLVFVLLAFGDQLTLVNATREHTAALVTEWEEAEAMRQLEREAHMDVRPDPKRGEEVFQTICMTCHRMDERLVGPPLNTVLPKYAGNSAAMEAFISNPVKVDPDYPPMPNPGLSLSDVKSVVAYLLGEAAKSEGESAPPGH